MLQSASGDVYGGDQSHNVKGVQITRTNYQHDEEQYEDAAHRAVFKGTAPLPVDSDTNTLAYHVGESYHEEGLDQSEGEPTPKKPSQDASSD